MSRGTSVLIDNIYNLCYKVGPFLVGRGGGWHLGYSLQFIIVIIIIIIIIIILLLYIFYVVI